MLQGAKTDLINPLAPLAPKARNSECQNLTFPLQIKPVKKSAKAIIGGFSFSPSSALMG